jgi:hypothetical protein
MTERSVKIEFDDFTQGYLCELVKCAIFALNSEMGNFEEMPSIAFSEINLDSVKTDVILSVIDICNKFQDGIGGVLEIDEFLAGIEFFLDHNEIGEGFTGELWGEYQERLSDRATDYPPLDRYPDIFVKGYYEKLAP